MGVFPANKVGRGQDNSESRAPTVAELSADQYNAELVDDNGTAFGSTVTAAALQNAASGYSFSGETASAADSLVIPITAPLCLKTTGADAEALTLADGTFVGQRLTIQLVVDGGGDGTLTPATSTSFGTIVFADAGDVATLEWRGSTTGWVILGTCDLAGVGGPVYTLA